MSIHLHKYILPEAFFNPAIIQYVVQNWIKKYPWTFFLFLHKMNFQPTIFIGHPSSTKNNFSTNISQNFEK